jgi:uncharacterized protein DUF4339
MRDDWYFSGPEGRTGPVSLRQLKAELASHPDADNVFVWHESLTDWVRAGDVAAVLADTPTIEERYRGHKTSERDWPEDAGDQRYSVGRLLMGVAVVALGCGLFYLGISGKSNELIDASIGVVLFVVGMFLIWGTRRGALAK